MLILEMSDHEKTVNHKRDGLFKISRLYLFITRETFNVNGSESKRLIMKRPVTTQKVALWFLHTRFRT